MPALRAEPACRYPRRLPLSRRAAREEDLAPALRSGSFEAVEELGEITTEIVAEIAAFLHEHCRQAERGDLLAHRREAGASDLEALQWIALAGVEAERHDQRGRCELLDAGERLVTGSEPWRIG